MGEDEGETELDPVTVELSELLNEEEEDPDGVSDED